jgi:membrane protein required for colicin V production
MNATQVVDFGVLGILLYCTFRGASRGLLSQLAWVVALLLCFKFSGTLSPAIEPLIAVDPPLKQWIAMLVVYVVLCGGAFLAAGVVSSWMEKTKILNFDRHLGGLLGFAKGVVICMTIMYFLITISPSIRNVVGQTYSGYGAAVILSYSQVLLRLVPEHAVPMVQHVIDRFNQHLRPAVDDLANAKPADPSQFPDAATVKPNGNSWLDGDTSFRLEDLLPDSSRQNNPTNNPQNNAASPPTDNADADPLREILALLPERIRSSLPNATLDAIQNASPEERRLLLQRLEKAVPSGSSLGQVLSEFLRSNTTIPASERTNNSNLSTPPHNSSAPKTSAASSPAKLSASDSALLREIAGIYSQRSDIAARAREHFAGVPPQVTTRVLSDWHADALGLSRDPDPGTDVNSRLDERILRQLNRAGIPLEQLDAALRLRLTQL